VLSAGQAVVAPSGDASESALNTHREQQAQLVRLSSRSTQVMANSSGHDIELDEPGLVVEAIRQAIAMGGADAMGRR
jgi:hypothetical protein